MENMVLLQRQDLIYKVIGGNNGPKCCFVLVWGLLVTPIGRIAADMFKCYSQLAMKNREFIDKRTRYRFRTLFTF